MPGKRKQKKESKSDLTQTRQARTFDALVEFDQFNKSILPQLKKMVLEDWSPEKIRRHFAPLVQATMIQKALSGNDKMLIDTMNRHEGMAVQRVESKTVYAKMDKKELAALALQKLRDAGIIQGEFSKVEDEKP